MIASFKRMLVHVDAADPRHPALDRAIELADRVGASLRLVDVVADLPRHARLLLPKDLQTLLVRERERRLDALATSLEDSTGGRLTFSTTVLCGRPGMEIIREVLRGNHDVVLKSHPSPDARGREPLFDTVDMQLLRQCPCPVWLVGPDPPRTGRVLAAVDPNPEDPTEQALNARILETALWLGRAEHHELFVLHVWHAFGQELLRPHADEAEVDAYVAAAKAGAQEGLDELLAPFQDRLGQARVHLEEGEAGAVIPAFARHRKIDLVVMGTVARSGIAGLIMGNTAERVLATLSCSVLTVKPEGFVSPVTL
jgi:universal stress protein E